MMNILPDPVMYSMTALLVGFIIIATFATIAGISIGVAVLLDKLAAYIMKRWWKYGER